MITQTDISATFTANAQGSRSLGYGMLDIGGISISYSVLPSPYGLGFFISYPSKPTKDVDPSTGKPKYFQEVFIKNMELRSMIDYAVSNAMENKGLIIKPTGRDFPSRQGGAPSTSFNQASPAVSQHNGIPSGQGFNPPPAYAAASPAVAPAVSYAKPQPVATPEIDDELPF